MIKAIIFDMDGVVIDTEPIYEQADLKFFSSLGVKDHPKKYAHLLTGKSLSDGLKIMKEKYGISGTINNLLKLRMQIIKKFYTNIKFVPGFLKFYNSIKDNYKTAIATSSHTKLYDIANQNLHLNKLFSGNVFFLHHVKNKSKPDPAIFLYAARKLKISPKNCLVIEDAVNGVKAAKNAKMKCIALATTHDKSLLKKADIIVTKYSQINLTKF